jgi:hypothetical protein
MVADRASLTQFDRCGRVSLGIIRRVFRWRDDKYVDVTAAYPSQALHEARVSKGQFLRNLKQAEAFANTGGRREEVMGPAFVYWANEMAAGKSGEATAFFRAHCSRRLRSWLEARRGLVARAAKQPLPTNNSIRVMT